MRTIGLILVLFAVWLLFSGIYTPLIISFGIGSCILVGLLARRMDVIDHEGLPLQLGIQIMIYWGWLIIEIVKANIDVAKCLFFPKKYLRPSFFVSRITQKSDLGKVIYANSVTLTPGTVTVDLYDENILVHALTKASADGVKSGEMDAKVTKVMGET